MKKFFGEFKEFIAKGNVVDLAVAVVIGGAFGAIVTSLVNDIIMPLISLVTGGVDVSDWKWVITPAVMGADGVEEVAETALRYGNFIQLIINFLIIALVIFCVVRSFNKLKDRRKKEEEAVEEEAAETTEEILGEIRDLLKKSTGADDKTE
ncbi:MAG: large-conductance mechanosensitive channel protein MscL [Clostridia bacterium]|nr:large-conductance mechanosensitive channel protein MscL [Clostridia bacterium]